MEIVSLFIVSLVCYFSFHQKSVFIIVLSLDVVLSKQKINFSPKTGVRVGWQMNDRIVC